MVRLFRFASIVLAATILLSAMDAHARRRRRRKRGAVSIQAIVDGALVLIDGKKRGVTPMKPVAVPMGPHTITVKKLGYMEFSERVKVVPGKVTDVMADMLPVAGVIDVTCSVAKAKVTVDGKLVGRVPLKHEVGVGKRTITVTASGYRPHVQSISADPGITYEIEAILEKGDSAGDGLALAPLGGGADGDLSLVPLTGGEAGEGDDLALTALPGLDGTPSLTRIAAVDPLTGATLETGATVSPAKPWYRQWYYLAGAGAAVVIVGATTWMLIAGRESTPDPYADLEWVPGESVSGGPVPLIWQF